jgi:hypothetical protein
VTATDTQNRRVSAREAKVGAGLQELERWLHDLIRQGLATVQNQPDTFWETIAARMVDAQCSGLARRLREMATIPYSGEGWPERLLRELSLLHLIIQSYKNIDHLSPGLQADIRTQIGWSWKKKELLEEPGHFDQWRVIGQHVTLEERRLYARRTWLYGRETGHFALLLDYAYGHGGLFETDIQPGLCFETEAVFYPSAYPLRALLKEMDAQPVPDWTAIGYQTIEEAVHAYAGALAANPWLDRFPLALQAGIVIKDGRQWIIRDQHGHTLHIVKNYERGPVLLALSGGLPINIFGEWYGREFLPLGVISAARFMCV